MPVRNIGGTLSGSPEEISALTAEQIAALPVEGFVATLIVDTDHGPLMLCDRHADAARMTGGYRGVRSAHPGAVCAVCVNEDRRTR